MKKRIPETDHGIEGEIFVSDFDEFQKLMRDKGFIETDEIIKSGINYGTVLEIGPGPGYLGLEWLSKTQKTNLYWLEISEDMKNIAVKNAKEYAMQDRVKYVISDATKNFPFENEKFDAVFTNGSLHEWTNPIEVFIEINRVLKTGGKFFVSDLKRNINFFLKILMKIMTKKKSMKKGLVTSIQAAYLKNEIENILKKSQIKDFTISENAFGLIITGCKE